MRLNKKYEVSANSVKVDDLKAILQSPASVEI